MALRSWYSFGLLLITACAVWAADPVAVPDASKASVVNDGLRQQLDLGGQWQARRAPIDLPFPTGDAAWVPQVVPHQENTLIGHDDIGPYFAQPEQVLADDGRSPRHPDKAAAYFRRSFVLPSAVSAGRRALLHCDGIAWQSVVWLNGVLVGRSVLGLAPSTYDVTAAVRSGNNELVIGVAGRAALWDADHQTFIAPIAQWHCVNPHDFARVLA
jgi:hypothetical protein